MDIQRTCPIREGGGCQTSERGFQSAAKASVGLLHDGLGDKRGEEGVFWEHCWSPVSLRSISYHLLDVAYFIYLLFDFSSPAWSNPEWAGKGYLFTVVAWRLAQCLVKYWGLRKYLLTEWKTHGKFFKGIMREAQNRKPCDTGKLISNPLFLFQSSVQSSDR